jgi:large subunit ribosomal protein L31
MKKDIHPEYRNVVFEDLSTSKRFIIASTVKTKETIELDGVTYPYYKTDVSSDSHPAYTGEKAKIMVTGNVDKFNKRYSQLQRK